MELHIERGAALELRQGRRERAGGTGAPLCTRPGESEAAVWPKWAEEIPLPLPLSVPACGCARIDVSDVGWFGGWWSLLQRAHQARGRGDGVPGGD